MDLPEELSYPGRDSVGVSFHSKQKVATPESTENQQVKSGVVSA